MRVRLAKLGSALSLLALLTGIAGCDDGPDEPPGPSDARTHDADVSADGGPSDSGDGGDGAPSDAGEESTCEPLCGTDAASERDDALTIDVDAPNPDADSPEDADAGTQRDGDGSASDVDATIPHDTDDPTCECGTSDASRGWPFKPNGGVLSLPCYCSHHGCPTYDQAISRCPVSDAGGEYVVLTSYADCDLVSVDRRLYFSPFALQYHYVYVYKASTLEMVGAYSATDVSVSCGSRTADGSRMVDSVEAGDFLGVGCRVASTRMCGTDAGTD